MKNKLMLVALLGSMGIAQAGDIATLIANKTNARIFYTWKSTNAVIRNARGGIKSSYTSINSGKDRRDTHANDLLVVYYPACENRKPKMIEVTYNAKAKGYGARGLQILENKEGDVVIKPMN